ncbi:MAG TPA: YihY/virulence factor BrkB family protein [Natronosporangium sp.]
MTVVSRIAGRLTSRYERTVAGARERFEPVDHAFRTIDRYLEAFGGRLAAAIAYYGFFATFALGVLGYALLGFLVERDVDLQDTVNDYLQENLPVVQLDEISAGRGSAGVFGLIALVFAGVAWVEALRSSQRRIWELEQAPGNWLLRRGIDIVVLLGLAILLGLSIGLATGIEYLLAGIPVLEHLGWLLQIGVNLVVAFALLAALPRLRIAPRRLLPPAAGLAVGLFLLNALGGLYIDRVRENAAYAVVATAAGLLVYLYLFFQLVLLCAAWAATAGRGRVVDMASGGGEVEPAD